MCGIPAVKGNYLLRSGGQSIDGERGMPLGIYYSRADGMLSIHECHSTGWDAVLTANGDIESSFGTGAVVLGRNGQRGIGSHGLLRRLGGLRRSLRQNGDEKRENYGLDYGKTKLTAWLETLHALATSTQKGTMVRRNG